MIQPQPAKALRKLYLNCSSSEFHHETSEKVSKAHYMIPPLPCEWKMEKQPESVEVSEIQLGIEDMGMRDVDTDEQTDIQTNSWKM